MGIYAFSWFATLSAILPSGANTMDKQCDGPGDKLTHCDEVVFLPLCLLDFARWRHETFPKGDVWDLANRSICDGIQKHVAWKKWD